jgi:hypothetical protein
MGNVVRCAEAVGGACGTIAARLAKIRSGSSSAAAPPDPDGPTAATTLTLVVTTQKLPFWALQRFAIQVHTSMARGIQPFHTNRDGDVLFAVSTDEVDNSSLPFADLGVIASEVAWDAILSSVPDLDPPDMRQPKQVPRTVLTRYVGQYEFAPGSRAQVGQNGDGLTLSVTRGSLYVAEGQQVSLAALSDTDFRLQNAGASRLRFDVDAGGAVRGFTINPGHWPIPARRTQ